MVCTMCHHQHQDDRTLCPYCGHKVYPSKDKLYTNKMTRYEPYLASLLLGSALLTTIFGVLSLWQTSLAVLSFFGATSGLMGIFLNQYQKNAHSVLLKLGYAVIVFGFLLNVFSFIYHFIAIFTDLF